MPRLPSTTKLIESAQHGDFSATYMLCRREKPESIPALVRLVWPLGGLDAEKFEALCECFECYEDRQKRIVRSIG